MGDQKIRETETKIPGYIKRELLAKESLERTLLSGLGEEVRFEE